MTARRSAADFRARKGGRLVMVTAYDAPSARIGTAAGADFLLVGDSLGMAVLGHDSTQHVTMDDMLHHAKAARRGAPEAFIVADLPHLSYATPADALRNGARLMQEAGADAVKLEGGASFAPMVEALAAAGVPVMGHLGLTPQTITTFRLQAKDEESGRRLLADARALENAGCWSLVLELVPAPLAALVTERIGIPTVGIGAGAGCDGQVLVFNDLVGLSPADFRPKFLKRYAEAGATMQEAIERYAEDVRAGRYPDDAHAFGMDAEVLRRIRS